jgi:hypothetical protein
MHLLGKNDTKLMLGLLGYGTIKYGRNLPNLFLKSTNFFQATWRHMPDE